MNDLTPSDATELFRDPPTRFVDLGDRSVAVRTVGSGPDALFVHGWPVSGATFRKLLPHLADEFTCHVIDLPGFGSSPVPAGPTTVDTHIATVRGVIDALDLDDVAVVGHDSGGLITRHAVAGDARVRAVGLVDTEQMRLGWRFRSFLAIRHVPGAAAALAWACSVPAVRRSRAVLGDAFVDRSLLDGELDELFLQPIVRDPARRRVAFEVLRSFDLGHIRALPDVHRRIDVPVHLVWGERDAFFPVARARSMVATFPDARLTVVPGAGLFSHEEQPAAVAAALRPALRPRPRSTAAA